MTSARRILMTCATTPLGRALVRELLDDPALERLLIFADDLAELPEALGRDPRVRAVRVQTAHARELWRALHDVAITESIRCVVHDPLAPLVGRATQAALHNARETSRHLLRLCAEHPTVERLVLRSTGDVYLVDTSQAIVITETHPLQLRRHSERALCLLEIDLSACARFEDRGLAITVLRCAEVLAPDSGSPLFDYLCAPICLRALGFDPMLNVLSVVDAARALASAARGNHDGVFNIPGLDTLPLSALIHLTQRPALAVPGLWLSPLYALRAGTTGAEFRYQGYRARFHHAGILSGQRAQCELGYTPQHAIDFKALAREVAARVRVVHWR